MKVDIINDADFSHFAPYLILPVDRRGMVLLGADSDEGEVMGTAVFTSHEAWAELCSIYVVPEYRKRGLGRMFLRRLREIPEMEEKPIMADFTDRMEGVRPFFDAAGFYIYGEKRYYEFMLGETLRVFERFKGAPTDGIFSMSSMTMEERKEAGGFLESFGWNGNLVYESAIRQDLSFVCLQQSGITGILLSSGEEENVLRIERVATVKENHRVFSSLINALITAAGKKVKLGTRIRFFGENEKLEITAKMLLKDALKVVDLYYTAVG